MISGFRYGVAVVLIGVGIGGCTDGPPRSEIERRFVQELPAMLALDRFEIVDSENTGTKKNPAHRSQFSAEMVLQEPLFVVARVLEGRQILRESVSEGTKISLVGTVRSIARADDWVITFDEASFSSADDLSGEPRQYFAANALILGTSDAAEWISEAEERVAARVQAERRAAAEARERAAQVERFAEKHKASLAPGDFGNTCTQEGQSRNYIVTAIDSNPREIWGGAPRYTGRSHIATAVVHAGVLARGEVGAVRIRCMGRINQFDSVPRHGIVSTAHRSLYVRGDPSYEITLLERIPSDSQ